MLRGASSSWRISIHDWFVEWIKNPSAGPGWEKVQPKSGTLVKLGVPGNETERIVGSTGEYNGRCQSVSLCLCCAKKKQCKC
jgi:hypothetical protein